MFTAEEMVLLFCVAKEIKERLAEFEEKERCGEWLDAIELAKIAIALQRQKWIPVSERLPKKPERGESGYIVQKKRVAEPFSAYWNGERWTNEDDDVIDEVMAWMPLPESFKEEEHEQTNACYGCFGAANGDCDECVKDRSEYCADWTEYSDSCEEWEGRE